MTAGHDACRGSRSNALRRALEARLRFRVSRHALDHYAVACRKSPYTAFFRSASSEGNGSASVAFVPCLRGGLRRNRGRQVVLPRGQPRPGNPGRLGCLRRDRHHHRPARRARTACVAGSRPASSAFGVSLACGGNLTPRDAGPGGEVARRVVLPPVADRRDDGVRGDEPNAGNGAQAASSRSLYRLDSLLERLLSPATLGETCLRRREVLILARRSPDV
jgi:hypothetical protein